MAIDRSGDSLDLIKLLKSKGAKLPHPVANGNELHYYICKHSYDLDVEHINYFAEASDFDWRS